MKQGFMTTLLSFVNLFFYFAQIYLLHLFLLLYFVDSGLFFFFLVEQPRKLPKFIGCLLVSKLFQLIRFLLVFWNSRVDGRWFLGVLVVWNIWRIWNHGVLSIVSLNMMGNTFSKTTLPVESIFMGISTFLSLMRRDRSYGLMPFCLFLSICLMRELEKTTWKGVDL